MLLSLHRGNDHDSVILLSLGSAGVLLESHRVALLFEQGEVVVSIRYQASMQNQARTTINV